MGHIPQSTGIGKAVKKLSKHKDPALSTVSAAFRKLMGTSCSAWRHLDHCFQCVSSID